MPVPRSDAEGVAYAVEVGRGDAEVEAVAASGGEGVRAADKLTAPLSDARGEPLLLRVGPSLPLPLGLPVPLLDCAPAVSLPTGLLVPAPLAEPPTTPPLLLAITVDDGVAPRERGALPLSTSDPLASTFPVGLPCAVVEGLEDALGEGCKEPEAAAEAEDDGRRLPLFASEEEKREVCVPGFEGGPAPLLEALPVGVAKSEALKGAVALSTPEKEGKLAAVAPADAVSQSLLVPIAPVSDDERE